MEHTLSKHLYILHAGKDYGTVGFLDVTSNAMSLSRNSYHILEKETENLYFGRSDIIGIRTLL